MKNVIKRATETTRRLSWNSETQKGYATGETRWLNVMHNATKSQALAVERAYLAMWKWTSAARRPKSGTRCGWIGRRIGPPRLCRRSLSAGCPARPPSLCSFCPEAPTRPPTAAQSLCSTRRLASTFLNSFVSLVYFSVFSFQFFSNLGQIICTESPSKT